MTLKFQIRKARHELAILHDSYTKIFATDEQKLSAVRYATLLLVEELGYKHWLASNLVELFFTQKVEICGTKIEMIQSIHGGNVLEMFENALDELNYRDTWYKDYHGGKVYTTNYYMI